MRKEPVSAMIVLLGGVCLQWPALAQNPPPQQQVTVVVDNANVQPPQPVKAVSVSVMFQDVTDARGVTNSDGQVLLQISSGAAQQSNLRVEVSGAGDLVIYQPPEGALSALPTNVNVALLPKGSPALLGPAQIQAMLHRMSLQIATLQKQNAALQTQVKAAPQQKPDLGAAIADWAQSNGFSAAQVDSQVQQWAQSIENQATASDEQKALAQLALKNFGAAAQLFTQASDADLQAVNAVNAQEQALQAQVKALQEAQASLLARQVSALTQLLNHTEQAAGAYQLNLQYHQATQTLQSAENTVDAQYKANATSDFQRLSLRAAWDVATASWMEGQITGADQSLPLLAQAASDFKSLARQYESLNDGQLMAEAVCNYAVVLLAEGVRVNGDQAFALLDQSRQAYTAALTYYTKDKTPQDWSLAENNLALVLLQEASRVSGDQATTLFEQAMQADQNALEVRTKDAMPDQWAQSETIQGSILVSQGERADPTKSAPLLQQAVQIFQGALTILTKANHPLEWGETQVFLGRAYNDLSLRTAKDQQMPFLQQAVQSFENALQVFAQASSPQEWGQAELYLGSALITESYVSGNNASTLLSQAVQALGNAGQVFTSGDTLAQPWASSQVLLGNALVFEALNSTSDKALPLLDQAVQAFGNALKIYSPTGKLVQPWALTELGLSFAFIAEGERASGDKATAAIDQAVQGYEAVLKVFTQADLPQQWAGAQLGLAFGLMFQALRAAPADAKSLFDQSAQAIHNSLQVYTQAGLPQFWAPAQLSLVELDLVREDFSGCLKQDAVLTDDALVPYHAFVRDALKLACQWGAQDKPSAQTTAKALLAQPFPSQFTLVDGAPAIYYLQTAPFFASGRAAWVALFDALQNDSGSSFTAALQQLVPLLQQ